MCYRVLEAMDACQSACDSTLPLPDEWVLWVMGRVDPWDDHRRHGPRRVALEEQMRAPKERNDAKEREAEVDWKVVV